MNRLIKFIKLPFRTKLIFIEAYVFLAISRILIFNMEFKKIAPLLGKENIETLDSNSEVDLNKVREVARAIRVMSKHTFWESKCLVQAYTAKFMLNRRKQRTTVYLGVAKDDDGKMIAHAWLRCGEVFVTGGDGSNKFAVTKYFT